MSILIDNKSRILVQGITGREGLYHSERMHEYGHNVVAGTSPGRGGDWVLDGKIPVFDTVRDAIDSTDANTSVIFVPAYYAADAIMESIDARVRRIICISEGIPIRDMMIVRSLLENSDSRLIGPNSPGVLTPGQAKAGIIPGNIAIPGNVGVVSRSGTLTYEVVLALKKAGIGVSSCIGIGGDPILGTNFVDCLDMFEADPHTDQIVLIGEIGGNDEELAAEFISNHVTKPVYAYIAGRSAPENRRMGHAGAIIEGKSGSAKSKMEILMRAGVQLFSYPEEISEVIRVA
ncbi:MAG: succinate--CoA ligase subunit alpha [Anaerolineaceae bacterium]